MKKQQETSNQTIEKSALLEKMFPHIAGYTKIKEEASIIVDLVLRKEEYQKVGARNPRGWFFYGKPGMGKTRLVKDLAKYINYPIVEISPSDSIKRQIKMDEDIVQGFQKAKEIGKCVILIDEMDKFAGYDKYDHNQSENLGYRRVLLQELDEIAQYDDVIIFAIANDRFILGDAVLRSGRFDRRIHFPQPDENDRRAIVQFYLKGAKLKEDNLLNDVVKMTCGQTCAEIECIVNDAKILSIHRGNDKLQLGDFTEALNRVVFFTIPKNDTKSEEESKLVAYHEIGHVLLAYMFDPKKVQSVSLIPQGDAAGYALMYATDSMVEEEETYRQKLKYVLAGMISVRVMTGKMTGGNESDLSKAKEIIMYMLNNGFYGPEYLECVIRIKYGYEELAPQMGLEKLSAKMIEILNSATKEIEDLLNKNKEIVEKLAISLVRKRELSNRDILRIIKNMGGITE